MSETNPYEKFLDGRPLDASGRDAKRHCRIS